MRLARLLLLSGALLLQAAWALAAGTATLERARAVVSDARLPAEVPFASGTEVALPDNWLRNRPGLAGVVWYEVPLDKALAVAGAPTGDPLVLLVTRLADTGALWLNGERLDTGAASEFARNRPLWIPLPAAAWRASGNVLHVRVTGQSTTRGGLAQLTLGPPDALRPGYDLRRLLQNGVPLTLMFSVVVCMFGGVALWLKTRRRTELLFVLMSLTWLPHALVLLGPSVGSPSQVAMLYALASTLLSNGLVLMLLLEHSKLTGPFWQRYLWLLWGVATVSFATGAVIAWLGLMRPALLGMLMWAFFALVVLPILAQVRRAWQVRGYSDISLAVTLLFWGVTVGHDFAIAADRTAFDAFFWAPTGALAVLLSLVWRSLESLALHRASAQHEIRQAVADVSNAHGLQLQQMRAEFDRAQAAEREAVLAAERSRLLHDLHDGLGSQLITALRMTRREGVPREDVARVIEDSLEDMRLIIDSLDLEERDLLPLLGNLRYRLEPRLNAIGVTLHWDVEALPELDYLSPETGLAIVRIVQEAVNNAVRHGPARNITVRVRATGEAVELAVRDDGRGFDVASPPGNGAPQRGLGAMRARAAKIGGTIRFDSGAGGTAVTLSLPLARA